MRINTKFNIGDRVIIHAFDKKEHICGTIAKVVITVLTNKPKIDKYVDYNVCIGKKYRYVNEKYLTKIE